MEKSPTKNIEYAVVFSLLFDPHRVVFLTYNRICDAVLRPPREIDSQKTKLRLSNSAKILCERCI